MKNDEAVFAVEHVIEDQEKVQEVITRLKRAQGQIGGVIKMMEEDRTCSEIVMQLSAVSKAVDRAAFSIIATGLRECMLSDSDEAQALTKQLERLFLTMA
ncbi:MAG TPA: metal-sensitive transcriptional regulator [Candidatus Nanopelagicaceae bacterium]|nr:metal-sensitive transcriptional regulator [Candidatus Nanopelagicaceae bacterium]